MLMKKFHLPELPPRRVQDTCKLLFHGTKGNAEGHWTKEHLLELDFS